MPLVGFDGERYTLEVDRPQSIGKIREFMGNLPVVVRAYAWARGMGADGINEASDLSVLANNYMATRLTGIRGITISHPHIDGPRMEMTRYSLEQLREDTGVGVVDVANRMADFGIDGPWLSHHPWLVPEPITPEAGELWSREDLDEWCDVLERVCARGLRRPGVREGRAAPLGHPPGRHVGRRGPRPVGDHLARLPAQARRSVPSPDSAIGCRRPVQSGRSDDTRGLAVIQTLEELERAIPFARRHIGPSPADQARMLAFLGYETLDDLAAARPCPSRSSSRSRSTSRMRCPRSTCSRCCATTARRTA